MNPPPRSAAQRRQDTLHRLEHDVDAWIATADAAAGTPYLVPLSFLWDGTAIWIATPAGNPTSQNLRANGLVRLGIGPTRDVVMLEGTVRDFAPDALPDGLGDAFAAHAGFDPRALRGFRYFRILPRTVQAWREANEIKGRDLMCDGVWLDTE